MRCRCGEDEEASWVKDASRLDGLQLGVDRGEEVEVVVREWQCARTALLEGDAPFWVEPDALSGLAGGLGRVVDTADAGAGELAGQEQRSLTLTALDLEDPLGIANVEHSSCKWGQKGGGWHCCGS